MLEVLRELLRKCRRLDEIGLDHGELSGAHSHVLVQLEPRPKPRIVDFESASTQRRPKNLTSICQYLFIRALSRQLAVILGAVDKGALISALRAYKEHMGEDEFLGVLRACGLTPK